MPMPLSTLSPPDLHGRLIIFAQLEGEGFVE